MFWTKIIIVATYAFQIILICFFPVPSGGSTAEMLFKMRKDNDFATNHPAKSVLQSIPMTIVMITATLTVTAAWLIPLTTIIFPGVVDYVCPFVKVLPNTLKISSILLLVIGNGLTYVAVRTLRSNVTFHQFGETTRLHTSGIYGYIRNPITTGLAAIFFGFMLSLPSAAMLIGFAVFLLNSGYRVRMEEIYLRRVFGAEYSRYQNQVGKYFPKISMGKNR
jgi:protein-S-isoprenylcysteine O-methyltransferase Ste14